MGFRGHLAQPLHFTHRETEAQRGEVNFSNNVKSERLQKAENSPPKDIHVLISRTCERYIIREDRGVFPSVIKLRTLRWDDYSVLSG